MYFQFSCSLDLSLYIADFLLAVTPAYDTYSTYSKCLIGNINCKLTIREIFVSVFLPLTATRLHPMSKNLSQCYSYLTLVDKTQPLSSTSNAFNFNHSGKNKFFLIFIVQNFLSCPRERIPRSDV